MLTVKIFVTILAKNDIAGDAILDCFSPQSTDRLLLVVTTSYISLKNNLALSFDAHLTAKNASTRLGSLGQRN